MALCLQGHPQGLVPPATKGKTLLGDKELNYINHIGTVCNGKMADDLQISHPFRCQEPISFQTVLYIVQYYLYMVIYSDLGDE